MDISELKSMEDLAQRSKVKDIISVAARKLATELVDLREQLKREETAKDDAKSDPKKVEPMTKKITECQLKDYCKYFSLKANRSIFKLGDFFPLTP